MTHQIAFLPDGRLHLHHGPIDLICQAWGTPTAIRTAYEAAVTIFPAILPAICAELLHLRTPLPTHQPIHPISRAMHAACASLLTSRQGPGVGDRRSQSSGQSTVLQIPDGDLALPTPGLSFSKREEPFITPMAAVAGAIADHILAQMTAAAPLQKAYVNNGGDIAFHLTPTHHLTCALITRLANPTLDAMLRPHYQSPARGIATSGQACKGQYGKSFSLGIADSVTILARTAAQADAAATIVANATDLPDHPGIQRRPADSIDPDSDLGARLITWHVPPLPQREVERSLDNGRQTADHLIRAGLIEGAVLALQGRIVTCLPSHQELAA